MSIKNEITRLQNAKASIKTAIEGKGVTVGNDVKLDGYATLIDSITTGSGGGEEYVNPDFYNIRTINGTNYNNLFYNYSGNYLDLSKWDTSQVTAMGYMFGECKSLTSLDVSSFNTSKVTDMYAMFLNCRSLTSLDVSNFNTSRITNMYRLFKDCILLTSLNLSRWDTSKVTNMEGTFYSSESKGMNLIHIFGELDLSSLTTGFYPSRYTNPIGGCKKLETLRLKNIYKNCTMTNNSKWSINLGDTAITDECLIYIIDQLPNLISDKGLATTTNIILTLPQTNTLTEEQVKIATDKGWQVANTTYDLPYYNVSYNLGENIITPTKQKALADKHFVLTLSTVDNYCFESVTVTMGDKTITPTYISNSDGFKTMATIYIAKVTADITITASAKEM